MNRILILRVIHGIFALYFIACLIYLYYAAIFSKIDLILLISVVSLGFEGIVVFILNKGDCPLIHVQRKIGDDIPFFQLFLPVKLAKKAVPFFAKLTWIGVALIMLRLTFNYLM
ncbi:MAG: hypothetical protein KA035_01380 [Candidatus Levybacteria bacterium]|nr:hypothetical protein [Candidatus Levybacteria bacterium]